MKTLTTRQAVANLLSVLVYSGKDSKSKKWQALPVVTTISENPIIEVCDIFVKMKMSSLKELGYDTGADLPWAEDHFLERLAGASNPGEQYKKWPHWNGNSDFMDGQLFSHTYQERFWPEGKGKRYASGNWQDVKNRMCMDPTSRQVFLAIWHPEDQSNNMVRVPCTIGYWFKINEGSLDITYLIRSCDVRRHLRNDIYMTQRLAMEMQTELRRNGIEVSLGNMNMWIGSLHTFQSDMYTIRRQLKQMEW